MAVTQGQIDALQQQIDALNKNLVEKSADINFDGKALEGYIVKLKALNAEYSQLNSQNSTNLNMSKVSKDLKDTESYIKGLKFSINDTNTFFNKLFGDLGSGFEDVKTKFGELTSVYSSLGSNAKFWTDYKQKIKDIGSTYGLSGDRLKEFDKSSRDIQSTFVGTGNKIEDLNAGIEGLYNTTNETNKITPEFAENLGDIAKVFDLSTGEVGILYGAFKNLNIGFTETTHLLEDLRYSAEKSALNTKAVVSEFTKNFDRLNEFSFKNGIQGMMELTKQSARLKVDMNKILDLSDQLVDPEKTVEFAANLQVLGGSFAQLGDFNQLMYDAAVAPEELGKNIAKATASMGTFNKETGKLDISFAERMQLKEISKFTNMEVKDLEKMAVQMHKVSDIKMALNFQPLSDQSYEALATMSEFKGGKYTIDGKAVTDMNLTDEGVEKLVDAQKTSMKDQRVGKMNVESLSLAKIEQLKFASFDTTVGLNENTMIATLSKALDKVTNGVDGVADQIKKGFFVPLENAAASLVSTNVGGVAKNATDAMVGFFDILKIKGMELLNYTIKNYPDVVIPFRSNTETSSIKTEKHGKGAILDGPSHGQGGIPLMVDGKGGQKAEGGEIILNKNVSRDPMLLGIASKLNEFTGGDKLYEKGGILNPAPSQTMTPDTNVENNNYNYNNEISLATKARYNELNEQFHKTIKTSSQEINNKINKISTETIQGGLSNKRSENLDVNKMSVSVGGEIKVGKVEFGELKITLNGDTSKIDMKELQSSLGVRISNEIKKALNDPNMIDMYKISTEKKGTGLSAGGKPNTTWYG